MNILPLKSGVSITDFHRQNSYNRRFRKRYRSRAKVWVQEQFDNGIDKGCTVSIVHFLTIGGFYYYI